MAQYSGFDHGIFYPSVDDIISIHQDIVSADEDATSGIIRRGDIAYAVDFIEHGHFEYKPETIHEKAFALMRLLAANHAFVDGNKRTALNSTWTFYAINGYYFDYGEEIKAILKMLAVMENMVDQDEAVRYFSDITYSEGSERVPDENIGYLRLTKWMQDHSRRFGDMDEISDPTEQLKAHIEFAILLREFALFVEEYQDDLADEIVSEVRNRRDEVVNSLRKGVQASEGADEELKEVLFTFFDSFFFENEPSNEFLEKVSDYVSSISNPSSETESEFEIEEIVEWLENHQKEQESKES